jgi:hypothetical protein
MARLKKRSLTFVASTDDMKQMDSLLSMRRFVVTVGHPPNKSAKSHVKHDYQHRRIR